MKLIKAVLITGTLLISNQATAQRSVDAYKIELCQTVEEMAKQVMIVRQRHPSITLSHVMSLMMDGEKSGSSLEDNLRNLVLDAYSENNPVFSIEPYQTDAINTFVNKWSAKCWEGSWG